MTEARNCDIDRIRIWNKSIRIKTTEMYDNMGEKRSVITKTTAKSHSEIRKLLREIKWNK